mgnify:CR=1 FL=1
MARLPFVDTHVHFSDMQNPNLRYVWLEPGWKHPILGDIEGISFCTFQHQDVVRHKLVQRIVDAYDRYQAKHDETSET